MRIASQVENNMIKVCIKCGKEKPLSEFPKDKHIKSGYKSSCKECNKKQYSIDTTITSKVCSKCGQEKPISEFNKNTSSKTGYRNECKKCRNNNRTKYIKKCEICGKEFETRNKKTKYCEECKYESYKNAITFNCEICGKTKTTSKFNYDKYEHHYCGSECQQIGSRKRIKCKCDYCGKDIEVVKSEYNKYDKHYCNKNCQLKSIYNNITFNCEICGKPKTVIKAQYDKTIHHYCSKKCANKGRGLYYSGENNPNWNSNLTDEERVKRKDKKRHIKGYDEFIQIVFKRDNYTCKCCNKRGNGELVIHHLNGYNWDKENRINPDNAVVLCENCHKEFHGSYGYGNNTKEQFEEFLNNKTNKSA